MPVILVGGHSRNIGKTSVVVGIIKALVESNWTAIKITQTGHNICADNGHECDCEVAEHDFILTEEKEKSSRADTTRFLNAGAKRALWLRTRQENLVTALPILKSEIKPNDYVIIESTSLRKFITPELYLQVLDPSIEDFKLSAQYFWDLADAYIIVNKTTEMLGKKFEEFNWKNIAVKSTKNLVKPYFVVTPNEGFINKAAIDFIRTKIYR
jgi:molybdopterin-guanine dinucleotide biosynthesis protein